MKKHPKFQRPNALSKKRVGSAWRAPRGIDCKQRIGFEWAGAKPNIGYGSPRASRGRHSSGFLEALVHNTGELARLNKETQAARIAAGVSGKNAKAIRLKARELGIKTLN